MWCMVFLVLLVWMCTNFPTISIIILSKTAKSKTLNCCLLPFFQCDDTGSSDYATTSHVIASEPKPVYIFGY